MATGPDPSEKESAPETGPDTDLEPKIVAFCCNWCTYTGADLAGQSRMKYPANVRIIRVPCSGRVNPQFILRAFGRGADGVMVCGCHPGDCHYATGNYFTRRRFMLMRELLEFNGIDPGRFHARWISGSEAAKFRDTVTEVTGIIKGLEKQGQNREPRDKG
ncbi:MAG: hydrogenase iron-sulfur subunit [Clostridiales bacterium]|nr:hydrogenase iron-sulfur subunit [Clostridiales bacterium]